MALLPPRTRRGALSPWRRLDQMESEMDRWMRGALASYESAEDIGWTPSVDLADADGEFTLTAELPGVNPSDVEIDVAGDALTIKGEKREEHEKKTKARRLVERSYGVFERTFTLPRSVDADKATAEFRNGVLTVHLPKREEAMGRKIEIESGE